MRAVPGLLILLAAAGPLAAAAEPLFPAGGAAPRIGERRSVEAAWEAAAGGRLAVRATARSGYAWVDVPAPAGGWDLARRAAVEADIGNEGADAIEAQLWVVADRGWESVGDFHRIAPGTSRTFACRLRETFPDGTPKLDPARIVALRLILVRPPPGAGVVVSGLRASGAAGEFVRPAGRIEPPAVTEGPPAAGRRVRHRLPIDQGTDIHSLLHLPEDWEPGESGPYPVIVELPGNVFFVPGCYSPGRPEQCAIGYGITRGRGAIWVSAPFVDRGRGAIVDDGWGDADATADYLRLLVEDACGRFGGDRRNVLLTGFSRGAIACGFIGLRNDRVAPLWKGFHCCQHYDGDGWNGATLAGAVERAARFRGAAVFHTDNDASRVAPVTAALGVPTTFVDSGLGAHATAMFLDDRAATRRLREWFRELVSR